MPEELSIARIVTKCLYHYKFPESKRYSRPPDLIWSKKYLFPLILRISKAKQPASRNRLNAGCFGICRLILNNSYSIITLLLKTPPLIAIWRIYIPGAMPLVSKVISEVWKTLLATTFPVISTSFTSVLAYPLFFINTLILSEAGFG